MYKPSEAELPTIPGAETLAAVTDILLDCIPSDKKRQNAWKVMAYIAEKTSAAARDGTISCKFVTKEIYTDLNGNPNREPSGWLSPLWKDVESQCYPAIKNVLVMRCKAAGFDVFPVIMKSEGIPAYYWIELNSIIEVSIPFEPDRLSDSNNDQAIIYQKDLSLELSLAGRLFFKNGMKWTSAKRYGFLTGNLLYFAFNLVYVMLIALVLWSSKGPVGGQELLVVIFGFLVPYFAYRHGVSVWHLFEDRIIIAPDWTIAWKSLVQRLKYLDQKTVICQARFMSTVIPLYVQSAGGWSN